MKGVFKTWQKRYRPALFSTFQSELDDAANVAECITLLRSAGFENAADRMTDLKNWADEDLDSDPLEIYSVRAAARFLAEGRLGSAVASVGG